MSISLPSPGFFSPFPHGTSSLSVSKEYLALDNGLPFFNQHFTCADLLVRMLSSYINSIYGNITLFVCTFQSFLLLSIYISYQASPRSLAATQGISFDFFSFGYLDVSVPQVRSITLCIHAMVTISLWPGSPIRTSLAITVISTSLELFAEYHVLLRLLLPRHPPFALFFLTI